MRPLILIIISFFFFSCIPIRIAPNIETDKLVKAKRFKRDLPNNYGFVFEDPKDYDEFYNFINAKYDLGFIDVESNVPISIGNNTYFLSFYERERVSKTINLIPIAIDAGLKSKGNNTILEDAHTSRTGHWYLVLIFTDNELRDCLNPNYFNHEEIIKYLRNLKREYLTTHNYIETVLNRNN
ncbi:hypothetical protein [Salegentibacter mishustinae]|uniref:hypothetical protein n=1 Tax=Salegentibacter mishustinae TaxID=270918 RepID=UPI002491122B|nr:hypothetical protein [Salegentibacter mishustinae]